MSAGDCCCLGLVGAEGTVQGLPSVLAENPSADNIIIPDIADPIDEQDAANKRFVVDYTTSILLEDLSIVLPSLAILIDGRDTNNIVTNGEYDVVANSGLLGYQFNWASAHPSRALINQQEAPRVDTAEVLKFSAPKSELGFLHQDGSEATFNFRCFDLEAGAHTVLLTSRNPQGPGVWIYWPSPNNVQIRFMGLDGNTAYAMTNQFCRPNSTIKIVKLSDRVKIWSDGEYQGEALALPTGSTEPQSELFLGNTEAVNAPLKGVLPIVAVQDVADEDNTHYMVNRIQRIYGTGVSFVLNGNSLTLGQAATFGPSDRITSVIDLSSLGYSCYRFSALGGLTTPQLTAQLEERIMPMMIGVERELLGLYEIGNDLKVNGATPEQAWENCKTYFARARALGWVGHIAISTIGYRTDIPDATVDAVNALVVAGALDVGFAFIVRIDLEPSLAVPGGGDLIHYNTAQYATIAGLWEYQLLSLFGANNPLPRAELSISAAAETVLTLGAPSVVGGTTVLSGIYHGFDSPSSMRLRYNRYPPAELAVNVSMSLAKASGGSALFRIGLLKNGSVVSSSVIERQITNSDVGALAMQSLISFQYGDYVEPFVENLTDNQNITATNLNMLVA